MGNIEINFVENTEVAGLIPEGVPFGLLFVKANGESKFVPNAIRGVRPAVIKGTGITADEQLNRYGNLLYYDCEVASWRNAKINRIKGFRVGNKVYLVNNPEVFGFAQ